MWLGQATTWIDERLGESGLKRTGAPEQTHLQPWATVLRVPTADAPFWFKANSDQQAYEAGVVELLARRRPDAVPALIAVDPERSWMLMADGGTRLRELIEAEHDFSRWLDALPRYAELQLGLAADHDALLACGAPDHGLDALPELYARLLEVADDIPAAELGRLRELTPWVSDACAGLSALGIPETIQHDDLHDGQIFVRDGTYLFFDWGDACVGHPFFTMSVTLEGVLQWGFDDVEGSVDIRPFRDAYLGPFTTYAPREDLEAGFATALRLGWICRALNYQAGREALGKPYPEAYEDAVAVRLRMFLAGL
jgi:hypothetical protein